MKINTLDPQQHPSPPLSALGIQHTRQSDAPSPPEMKPQESFELQGLQLLDFESAVLVTDDDARIELDREILNQGQLLSSLKRVAENIDFDAAMALHRDAQSLIQSMRSQQDVSFEQARAVEITGAFGTILLDLEKLQPETLRQLFSQQLEAQRDNLQDSHQSVSSLSQRIRAGFDTEHKGRAQQLLQTYGQDMPVDSFLHKALGFAPLNQEATVRHLFQNLGARAQDAELQAQLIQERVNALIESANRLEAELELAPTPDSPDIVELFRQFLNIFRQLDADIAAIMVELDAKRKFERKLLGDFAKNMQAQAQYHAGQLEDIAQRQHQRVRAHLALNLHYLKAAFELTQQHATSGRAPLLQSALSAFSAATAS